jgi:hypothetical protein
MAYYFNRTNLSFSPNPPGTPIPFPLLFLGMPLIGLAFLMFLPAAGFYLVGKALVVGVARGGAEVMRRLHATA